jgi:uncharacterized glyoxalase superfamily protein PhnB
MAAKKKSPAKKRPVAARKTSSAKQKTAGAARRKLARRRAVRRPAAPQARKQPETLRLRDAAPGFTVGDVHASLAWYRDVVGFVVKERWEHEGELRGVELAAGSVSFYLGQDDWRKGRDRKKGEGFRIYCSTAQDVDALAAAIKSRGGVLEYEPKDQPWGGRDFALADPDGFKLTIGSRF